MSKNAVPHQLGSKQNAKLSTRILFWLIIAIIVIVTLHLIFQFLNLNVYNELHGQIFELSNRFDLDDESSIGTWFSQAMFLSIAITAAIAGYLNKKRPIRRLWYLISVIGLVFSIDEVVSLHEFVLQSVHLILFHENAPTFISNSWWIFAPTILLLAIWLCYQVFKYLPKSTLRLFVAGAVMIVFGAVVVDAFGSALPKNSYASQGITIAIEESLEFLGTATVLYAIVAYIEQNFAKKIQKTLSDLNEN